MATTRRRNYAAEYAARSRRAAASGTTVYGRRQARARAEGWESVGQKTYWRTRMTDAYVRELAEEIGGPVEPERPRALMSRKADAIVNGGDHGRGKQRRGDWHVRLLRAAGR